MTGYERIEFKLYTPVRVEVTISLVLQATLCLSIKSVIDYALTPRSQIYVLHFCSREMIDNEMTRINRTYEVPIDTMVVDMMRSDLDSKKNLIVEETKGLHKFVMPRIKPLKAIAKLSSMSEPLKYNSSGMLFYEDSTGFRFRSLENMLAINGVARL